MFSLVMVSKARAVQPGWPGRTARECPDAPWLAVEGVLQHLVEDGLARRREERVQLTDRGRLLADSIGAEIMDAFSVEPVTL